MVAPIPNDVFQFSTYAALKAGFRIGQPRAADLTSHGTDGIGTFEDGKLMMQSASQAYSIDENGKATISIPHARLAFAMVTIFHPLQTLRIQISSLKHLDDLLSTPRVWETLSVGGVNTIMTLAIQATFSSMELSTGIDEENTRSLQNVRGCIGGFIVPAWMESTSGPRIHCHFLSDDTVNGDGTRVGGRVVEFETAGEAVISLSKCGRFHLGFPQVPGWEALRLS